MEIVAKNKLLPSIKEIFQMGITFSITVFAWIFFRAENIQHAFEYISRIFDSGLFSVPRIFDPVTGANLISKSFLLIIIGFTIMEWLGREGEYALEKFGLKQKRYLRYSFYYCLLALIYWFGGKEQEFIYFQF